MEFLVEIGLNLFIVYFYSMLLGVYVVSTVFVPVYTVPLLKSFVDTIVFNNWLFFLILAIVLIALKFFKYQTAKNFVVSFLYNLLIIMTVLYLFLYCFHFDTTIYAIIRIIKNHIGTLDGTIIEVFNKTDYIKATDNNCLYSFLNTLINHFIDYVKWSIDNVFKIDTSCFHVAASSINILQILWTGLKVIGISGFAIISSFLFGLFILICGVVPAATPWIVSFFLVWITNKLIFEKRFNKKYNSLLFKFLFLKMFRKNKGD